MLVQFVLWLEEYFRCITKLKLNKRSDLTVVTCNVCVLNYLKEENRKSAREAYAQFHC